MELCKHQIKDTKASTWQKEVFRSCKLAAKEDGYCDIHHPTNIAKSIAQANVNEIVDDKRVIERREESMVGAFLRIRDAEKFSAILDEIRTSEETVRELRRIARG